MRVPPKPSISRWDFPFKSLQLLGYPQGRKAHHGSFEVHSTAIQIFDSVEQMAIYFVKDYSNQQWRQEIGLEVRGEWGLGCVNLFLYLVAL